MCVEIANFGDPLILNIFKRFKLLRSRITVKFKFE